MGPQEVAGHANMHQSSRPVCFVGENNDLMWRALTETTLHGWSPLKTAITDPRVLSLHAKDMVAAAVLYDETVENQLTNELFDGVATNLRGVAQSNALIVFNHALNTSDRERRWTSAQRDRLREFIDTVEGLEL